MRSGNLLHFFLETMTPRNPLGVGVVPNWAYRHGWRNTYYRDCRMVRQRIVTVLR